MLLETFEKIFYEVRLALVVVIIWICDDVKLATAAALHIRATVASNGGGGSGRGNVRLLVIIVVAVATAALPIATAAAILILTRHKAIGVQANYVHTLCLYVTVL